MREKVGLAGSRIDRGRRATTRPTSRTTPPPGRFRKLLWGGIVSLCTGVSIVFAWTTARPALAQGSTPVTYTRDVAPIFQTHCQECHRPGGIGPFSLLGYDEAKKQARTILFYTERRLMPPWKAADGYGEFQDARRLADGEIDTIRRWVTAGTPYGDPKDLPQPRVFSDGWALGAPDMVLEPEAAFKLPARGNDIYRDYVLPYYFTEERWVSAVEILPGAASVVHHAFVMVDPEGKTLAMDRADRQPGFAVSGADAGFSPAIPMAAWVPGIAARRLPPGVAWRVPARSYLVLQVHYTRHGTAASDRTRIGLHFADGPVDKRVRTTLLRNNQFAVPAGAVRYPVTAAERLPLDITALAVRPHQHEIGREIKSWATRPDGMQIPLVWVNEWDPHWEQLYAFKQSVKLPHGAMWNLQGLYDNTAANPRNPNRPPKRIAFGPNRTDEMCDCYILYTIDEEHLTQAHPVEQDGMELRE